MLGSIKNPGMGRQGRARRGAVGFGKAGRVRCGKARPGMAGHGRPGLVRQGPSGRGMVWKGVAGPARLVRAWLGKAGLGKARQARHGGLRLGQAGHGKAGMEVPPMPSRKGSLLITDRYRSRLFAIRDHLQTQAPAMWDRADRLAPLVEQAQRASLRLTAGYLSAFLHSETGKPVRDISISTKAYSGLTADGQPLAEGMRSPLIGFFAALKQGSSVEEARAIGIDRAKRQVGMNYDAAHRKALSDTIKADERFTGGLRAVRGTCGACAAFSGTPHMQIHPGCHCVEMPVVAGAPNTIALPTGTELFNAKTPEEQDAMVGPDVAERLRKGEIRMADLAGESHLDSSAPNFITQAPVGAEAT